MTVPRKRSRKQARPRQPWPHTQTLTPANDAEPGAPGLRRGPTASHDAPPRPSCPIYRTYVFSFGPAANDAEGPGPRGDGRAFDLPTSALLDLVIVALEALAEVKGALEEEVL
jgi:hypothetical protein